MNENDVPTFSPDGGLIWSAMMAETKTLDVAMEALPHYPYKENPVSVKAMIKGLGSVLWNKIRDTLNRKVE